MDSEILRYIREHRDTYTRDAIVQHLLAAGHPAEEIDAAWRQTVEAKDESPASQSGRSVEFTLRRFLAALAIYVVGLLVVTNLLNWLDLFLGAIFYCLAVAVGILYPIFRHKTDEAAAIGVLCGLAIVILLFFVAPGLCTVATDAI